MKKIFKLGFACLIAACAVSCASTRPITATSNAVGNKVGVAQATKVLNLFGGKDDVGINTAAKNAGITHISHVDAFTKNYVLWSIYGVRVYGE